VAQASRKSRKFYKATMTNSSKHLAFMVWVRLQEAIRGTPIRPAFYDDSFVSLLPGELHTIRSEYAGSISARLTKLVSDGWNVAPKEFHKGHRKTLPCKERSEPAAQQAANGN
jgi:hypothetical protein